MSLNEDLLPDPVLEVPLDTADSIPQQAVAALPNSTFIANTNPAGEVMKFAPVFVEQKEQAEHLVDLASTQNQIQAQGAISVENALVVDSLMPGFINENNPQALFTKTPTKTQYSESLLSIASQVDSQYAQLKTAIEENTAAFFTTAGDSRNVLQQALVTGLIEINRVIAKALNRYDREDPCQIPYIFNNRKKLADLLRDSFHDFTGDGVKIEGETNTCPYAGTLAQGHLEKLRDITSNNRDLLDTIELLLYSEQNDLIRLNGGQYIVEDGKAVSTTIEADFKYQGATMARIVDLLASNGLRDRLQKLDEVYVNYQNYFQTVPALIAEIEKDEKQSTFAKLGAITSISSNCITAQMHIQAIINIVGGFVGIMSVMSGLFNDLSDQT